MADKTEMRVAGLRQIDSSPALERPHPFSGHPAVRNSSSGAVRLAKSNSAHAFSGNPSEDKRGLMGPALRSPPAAWTNFNLSLPRLTVHWLAQVARVISLL